jgi:hypothetical protein
VDVHPYFWRSRTKYGLVSYEVAAEVARSRRAWFQLNDEGRTEIYGYSPRIGLWVRVIVLPDGRLFNAFWDAEARTAVRKIARRR